MSEQDSIWCPARSASEMVEENTPEINQGPSSSLIIPPISSTAMSDAESLHISPKAPRFGQDPDPEETMHLAQIPSSSAMETTKVAQFRKLHIYERTRRVMGVRTGKMFVFGLRDYQRHGHIPTKRTIPTLLKRRYSLEVNTEGWNKDFVPVDSENQQATQSTSTAPSFRERTCDELELVTPDTPALAFPTPHRYTDFNKWLAWNPPANDDHYLELETAKISNNEFLYITDTYGPEKWMRDNGLDMALMVLSHNKSCEASKIGIASSVDSQICRYPDADGKEDYARRFGDKDWIFMPVNDGMLGVENDGINGIHWSVVALDLIHKTVHYFDSLFINNLSYINLAKEVSQGMLRLLGRDIQEWQFEREEYSPNQFRDNTCDFDGGACAPFVYTMVQIEIDHIQGYQCVGLSEECRLGLSEEFRKDFRSYFNSYDVRRLMQTSIAHAKMHIIADMLSQAHDKSAVAAEDVELLDEPPLRFNIPLHPQPSETDTATESDGETTTFLVRAASEKIIPAVDIQVPLSSDTCSVECDDQDISHDANENVVNIALGAIF